MKTCKKCETAKDQADFYARQNICKECTKTRARANRAARLEYYRAYDRERSSQAKRVKARAEYAKTAKGRAAIQRAKYAWSDRNPYKRKANFAVSNAIRDGKLIKQPCEVCNTTHSVEAHHDDYSKPLDVRWLCTRHHAEHHVRERELARRAA